MVIKKTKRKMRSVSMREEDAQYLDRIAKKYGLVGKWSVIGRIIAVVKDMKWESELR